MNLGDITIQDFKNQFFRDFPYLNIWDETKIYNIDNVVYYSVNGLFYKCKNNGTTSIPTTILDWELVNDNILNYVLDADITKAQSEAKLLFNQSLFSSDAEIVLAFNYITAHFLAIDIRRSGEGINSKGEYLANSQSVGSISESKSIPNSISENPYLNIFTTTGYGQKYIGLVLPRLIGRISVVSGATNA
ncbi:DUF4054 domain-containing protein [Candidatus Gracilibacteria bacterium]|nr:DUF4054 domain-containing protein [Candidatus Gracilibacteria bacterium]